MYNFSKKKTNPLEIINILLPFQKLKNLIGWLGFNAENSTKLITFIMAVEDKYDNLAADYN